jgi:hypothetical protein
MPKTSITPGSRSSLDLPRRWTDLSTVSYDLLLTALTPIAHAQSTIGNDSIMMTERVIDVGRSDAEPEDVPCITGNTLRHALREALCGLTLRVLNVEIGSLPLGAQQFLLSGGGLGRQAKSIKLDGYRRLVESFPYLPLFGGGIGTALIPGKLEVGYGILVCRQNADRIALLCPSLADNVAKSPHAQDLRERRILTRRDPRRSNKGRALLPKASDIDLERSEEDEKGDSAQMIAGYEVLCAGARFLWQVGVQLATTTEHSALLCALVSLAAKGQIGAKGATGHGRMRLQAIGETGEDRPLSNALARSDEEDAVVVAEQVAGGYVSTIRERKAEILDFLGGLGP